MGGDDDGHLPPHQRIEPLILENLGPNLYVAEYAGEPTHCLYVKPLDLPMTWYADTKSISVLCSRQDMTWAATVMTVSPWLHIVSGTSGIGNGTIEILCDQYTDPGYREGAIDVTSPTAKVNSLTVIVTQYDVREALIWSPPDVRATDAMAIQSALTTNGIGSMTVSDITLVDLADFSYVFACFGTHPYHYILEDDNVEMTQLVNYLNGGGRLYVESTLMWSFHKQSIMSAMFNIEAKYSYSYEGDLKQIVGTTCLQDLDYEFSGFQHYIDRLTPQGAALPFHVNSDPPYICGVAYDHMNGSYRTIGVSFSFAGLVDSSESLFTRVDLMERYLDFFDNGCPSYEAEQACCLATGQCLDLNATDCQNIGGVPQGYQTKCAPAEACCFPDGSCLDMDPLCCAAYGGAPQGAASVCLGDVNHNEINDACETYQGYVGDVNNDGEMNVLDALLVVNSILGGIILSPEELLRADCNRDGECNILDVLGIVNVILGVGECEP